MIELFQNKTVSTLSLNDYIHWILKPDNVNGKLALPPIQRGFVWKPKQIQDLWDSLLRNMPIGSVMLQAFEKNTKIYNNVSSSRKIEISNKSGYFLMDGQQRSLAILLGFPNTREEVDHKLWIDFDSKGLNGSLFQFRITTKSQVFGYNNYGTKLSLSERRNANLFNQFNIFQRDVQLQSFSKKSNKLLLDYKFTFHQYRQDVKINFKKTKPWKASDRAGKYIFEVKRLWKNIDTLEKWKNEHFPDFPDLNNSAKEKIENFYRGFLYLKTQWVPLILIPKFGSNEQLEHPTHDSLTMLFERISTGGTRLSSNNLLFSMIKQAWPEAHDIVTDLQAEVGSLMRPTDYILTAFRMSALLFDDKDSIADESDPDAKFFHNHLHILLGDNCNEGILRKLISTRDRRLQSAFVILINTIKYNSHVKHGIPNVMFPYLHVALIQVLLFWIIKNEIDEHTIVESRDKIIQFILFWNLSCRDIAAGRTGSKKIILFLKDEGYACFPAENLYKILIEKDVNEKSLFITLRSVPIVSNFTQNNNLSTLLTSRERAIQYFGEDNIELYSKFSKNKYLLLWLQRDYIEKRFKDFNPISGQDKDSVPYDFDHLIPQSNWSSKRRLERNFNNEKNKKFEDLWIRRSLGNSIGNYRVLDASDNRSRGDEPLVNDLLEIHDMKHIKKKYWKDFCFHPESQEEIRCWEKASPSKEYKFIWDDDRLNSFQAAIESRVLFLYKTYITESKLSEWL